MDLGLEAAGIGKTIWQVEKDPYARRVLQRHWPDVQRFDDVTAVGASSLRRAHVIHGGFPCTDTSVSGQVVRDQAGLDGAHSSLWWEMLRVCGELLPEFIIVENPPGLITNRNGIGRVLGGLSDIGYDARYDTLSSSACGAPHARFRVFIIAQRVVPDTHRERLPEREGLEADWAYATTPGSARWFSEPDVGRVARGIPNRVDRMRCLGNAITPAVAYQVGLALRTMIECTAPSVAT
jgi:DNA (cytosine-5)-methyltransferase 1|tara:strand:+ start:670 stop:1380 length:711 start_codon:yes stop_codon:yes gene_type:complete